MKTLATYHSRNSLLLICSFLLSLGAVAQPTAPSANEQQRDGAPTDVLGGMRWRMIGPFRGGRSIAVAGVPGQPNTYYFGAVGGGVWKTTNGGETWQPISDGQMIASIGAIAVAPSNPEIIYVGTGEADLRSDLTYGDGVYKSTDGGKTWKNISCDGGLKESQHIARIVIDPRDPNVVLVAALGHAYGPNKERGVYRSTDGGATWKQVLFRDENTGAIELAMDPDDPKVLFAALWKVRRPPWSTYPPLNGNGAIYRSGDGGATWTQVTGGGLPGGDWGRVGITIARISPSAHPASRDSQKDGATDAPFRKRIYALIDVNAPTAPSPRDADVAQGGARKREAGGLYRSDDGGKTWALVGTDPRIKGRGWYFSEISVDPKNADIVYVPNVSIYRSTDGGKTFTAIKGAPGGDDYHQMWIDAENPRRMIFGSDQGVGVSVDGGATWSSWYNQPTGQFYHVTTDNQFPYRVFGAQQDSGSVSTTSRSDTGSITFRDWYTGSAGESGYIAPDPSDPNIVYGGETYGGLQRLDRRTGQVQNISPAPVSEFGREIWQKELRFTWTSPLVFSPQDPKTLYFGAQYLLRSQDRGNSWQRISGDLTGADPNFKASAGGLATVAGPDAAMKMGAGVIYTIAPSAIEAGLIWVGTDTGLIWLTRDEGKTWANVTPSGLTAFSKISMIDAGHFSPGTAYAAVDRHRLDDLGPHIYATHDYGKTWKDMTSGIPSGAYVRVVREDTVRKELLLAGTELGPYVSGDGGKTWVSLSLNMGLAPVHDLVLHGNDLLVATHGRAFWILDDISPLRQSSWSWFCCVTLGGEGGSAIGTFVRLELKPLETPSASAYLFRPSAPVRIRASVNTDTPLPPEVPAGENPPAGAIIYYSLHKPAQSEVTLEILDTSGGVLRKFSSSDTPELPKPSTVPFPMYWFHPSERLTRDAGLHRFVWDLRYARPQVARPGFGMNVANETSPLEPEGPLVLPGRYQVRLTVGDQSYTQSLEVKMDPRVTASSDDLQKQFALEMKIYNALQQAVAAQAEIRRALDTNTIQGDRQKMAWEIMGSEQPQEGGDGGGGLTLARVITALSRLLTVVESADAAPTAQAQQAAEKAMAELQGLMTEWEKVRSEK